MKRMRSVPPAEFERDAAALSPSNSFSMCRTESGMQPGSRQIAVKHKKKRFILPAPTVLAIAMSLSPRHGFRLPPEPDVALLAWFPARVSFGVIWNAIFCKQGRRVYLKLRGWGFGNHEWTRIHTNWGNGNCATAWVNRHG